MKFMRKRLQVVSALFGVVFLLVGCGSSSRSMEMDMSELTNGYKIVDLCDEDAYLKHGDKLAPVVAAAMDPENEVKIIQKALKLIGTTSYEITEELSGSNKWYYYGDVKKGKPDGYGVIMYEPHGSIAYVGQFEKGVAKGYGLFLDASKVIQFEGYIDEVDLAYISGSMYGNKPATYSKADGEAIIPFSYYEMSVKVWNYENNPILSDKASEVLRLAPEYIGEIKNGQYSGKGILYNPDGTVTYEGKFEKGEIAD